MIDLSHITAFDIGVAVILAYSALIGLKRGFSTEVLTLLSWGAAIFFTLFALAWGAQDYGRDIISPDSLADIVTSVILFIFGLYFFRMLAEKIGHLIKTGPIGPLDRGFGALFGFMRGALVVTTLYLLFSLFVKEDTLPRFIEEAQSRPIVSQGANYLAQVFPKLVEKTGSSKAIENMQDIIPNREELTKKLSDETQETFMEKIENMINSDDLSEETTPSEKDEDKSN